MQEQLRHAITLSTLPMQTGWVWASKKWAVLSARNKPVVINVYGTVRRVKLLGFISRNAPYVEVRLWSAEDAERALVMFDSCELGQCSVH